MSSGSLAISSVKSDVTSDYGWLGIRPLQATIAQTESQTVKLPGPIAISNVRSITRSDDGWLGIRPIQKEELQATIDQTQSKINKLKDLIAKLSEKVRQLTDRVTEALGYRDQASQRVKETENLIKGDQNLINWKTADGQKKESIADSHNKGRGWGTICEDSTRAINSAKRGSPILNESLEQQKQTKKYRYEEHQKIDNQLNAEKAKRDQIQVQLERSRASLASQNQVLAELDKQNKC